MHTFPPYMLKMKTQMVQWYIGTFPCLFLILVDSFMIIS